MCLFLAFDVKIFCNEIYIYYLSLFVILTCDYLLIVGVEGYCCTWSHSIAHTHTHTRQDSSRRWIGPSQRPLPNNTQHSQETGRHPCHRWHSNPQSQQLSGRRSTPLDRAATGIGIFIIMSQIIMQMSLRSRGREMFIITVTSYSARASDVKQRI